MRVLMVSLVGLAAVACGAKENGSKTAAARSSAASRAVVASPSPTPKQSPSPSPTSTPTATQPVVTGAAAQSGALLPDPKSMTTAATAPMAVPTISINFVWKEGAFVSPCLNRDPTAPVQLATESEVTYKSMKKNYAALPNTTCQLETYPQRQNLKPGEYVCDYGNSNCSPHRRLECEELNVGTRCTTPTLP